MRRENLRRRTCRIKLQCILSTILLIKCCSAQQESFIQQPEDGVANIQQVFVFNCTVANRVGQVQWLRNSFGLGLGPTFLGFPRYQVLVNAALGEYPLMISNVQLEDDALFECQVGATNSTPGMQSRQAHLTVQVPPASVYLDGSPIVNVILNTPQNLTCYTGGGKPAPSVTWRSGANQITDNVYTMSTTQSNGLLVNVTSLVTVIAQLSDQGRRFQCDVINPAMLTPLTASATLNVLYAPEITMTTLPSSYVKASSSVQINCAATANPGIISWTWSVNNVIVPGQYSSTYVIQSVGPQLNGANISCQASNSAGDGQQSIILNVQYGPLFNFTPQDVSCDLGSVAQLSCFITGNPAPSIVWQRQGSVQILGSGIVLTLADVQTSDFGTYTCTGSSAGFTTISCNVRLLPNGAPTVSSLTQQSAAEGETGSVICDVIAMPKLISVEWLKNDQKINFTAMTRYSVIQGQIQDGNSSTLQIVNIQQSDYSVYNCTATNSYGVASASVALTTRAVIPVAYILAAVFSALFLVIVISIVVCLYRRHAGHGSELGSDSSDCSIAKRAECDVSLPETRTEYSNSTMSHGVNYSANTEGTDNSYWSTDVTDPAYSLPATKKHASFSSPYDQWTLQRHNPHELNRQRSSTAYSDPPPASNMYGTYPRQPKYSDGRSEINEDTQLPAPPEMFSSLPRSRQRQLARGIIRPVHPSSPQRQYINDVMPQHRYNDDVSASWPQGSPRRSPVVSFATRPDVRSSRPLSYAPMPSPVSPTTSSRLSTDV